MRFLPQSRAPRAIAQISLLVMSLAFTACSDPSTQDDSERNEDGTVVDGGDVGVFALRVGDCLDVRSMLGEPSEPVSTEVSEVAEFEAIPCTAPHSGEVVTNDESFYADIETFSSSDELVDAGTERCIADLTAYTATAYDVSPYDVVPLVPTSESWEGLDDRGLICIGVTLDEALVDVIDTSSSIKAAGTTPTTLAEG